MASTDPLSHAYGFVEPDQLPTPLAQVARRVHAADPDALSDHFLALCYFAESQVKLTAIALLAGLRSSKPELAQQEEYELVRAAGMGTWEESLFRCTTHAQSGFIDKDLQPLVNWLVQKRPRSSDEWAHDAWRSANDVLERVDDVDPDPPRKLAVRHIYALLTRIRNKTRGHGAVGHEFYEFAIPRLRAVLSAIAEQSPHHAWKWMYLSRRAGKGNVRALHLSGLSPRHLPAEMADKYSPREAGLYIQPHDKADCYHLGSLIVSTHECDTFHVSNGNFSNGRAEFLDYSDGGTRRIECRQYEQRPAPLPRSTTEGSPRLEIFSNTFGNIPAQVQGYVNRPELEADLLKRLCDRNHAVITLHGRGGIGKTSLALHAVHAIDQASPPRFEHLLWFSSRDLDLRPERAVAVRRTVGDLESIAGYAGELLDLPNLDIAGFAALLQDPCAAGSEGLLLVFDNFETLDDPKDVQRFLDDHTHSPNKVLITSRERAFSGDFAIEVYGMELAEADELLRQESRRLGIERIVTQERIEQIHEYTDGHAYVMRVLLGEIANADQWVPLKSLVPRREDLLEAVFERSFNKLDDSARWAFLLAAGWRQRVPELGLLVVLGGRELNAERGLQQCVRLSLLQQHELPDGSFCYTCPELARLFAKKKRESDPDRLLLEEDLETLQTFGGLGASPSNAGSVKVLDFLFGRSDRRVRACPEECDEVDELLLRVAELDGRAWSRLARFRRTFSRPSVDISYAYRRAVEECPDDGDLWRERATHAAELGDDAVHIASLISAVDKSPDDREFVREVAFELCKYLNDRKSEIPMERRGVYLATVRTHMAKLAGELDPTGLSRLAWLYLLEDNQAEAWRFANLGLEKDSTNTHCLGIVERIDRDTRRQRER